MAFARYVVSRAGQGLVMIVFIVILVFVLIKLAPGDPVSVMVGEYPHTDAYEREMRAKFGLDKPVYEQLALYLASVSRLDFGFSFRYQVPVAIVVTERIGATVLLMGSAMLLAVIFGVTLGFVASLRPYSWLDNMGTVFSLLGYSVPVFWLGQILIVIFAVQLGWLPSQGIRSVRETYVGLDSARDVLRHMLLPVIVLSFRYLAINSRMTRASMLEVVRQDFVTTARSKGLGEGAVMIKHVFRNALLPIVTVIGTNFGFLLTGSVLVETVFGWPGVGLLTFEAVNTRDSPVLLAVFIMVSAMVLVANFITDVLYAFLDPRIRY